MPRPLRTTVLIAVLLVTVLAAPTRAEAASSRSKKAQAAAKLNTLRATDRQLSAAVSTLTSQVNTQIARLSAARRAATIAEVDYDAAAAALQATQSRIDKIRGTVVAHAVETYMRPQGNRPIGLDADNLNEQSRQRALWNHVENKQADVLDELHAARQDQAVREAVASRARDRAAQRKRDASAQLDGLAQDLKAKRRLSSALAERIRDAQAEEDAANGVTSFLSGADNSFVTKSGLIWPVKGRLTSGFGRRWGRLHAGIDLAAPRGTPIRAARAGRVIFSGWMGGYGNAVIVNHGGGMATLYGHQSRRNVKVGQTVKQGQVIGYVGSTGHSTGNHLHFEVRLNGKAVNPRRYL